MRLWLAVPSMRMPAPLAAAPGMAGKAAAGDDTAIAGGQPHTRRGEALDLHALQGQPAAAAHAQGMADRGVGRAQDDADLAVVAEVLRVGPGARAGCNR